MSKWNYDRPEQPYDFDLLTGDDNPLETECENCEQLQTELDAARKEIEAYKIKWHDATPENEPDLDVAILAIVETNKGANYFICQIDEHHTLVDLEYGDDYGWQWDSVDRWCLLEDVANS